MEYLTKVLYEKQEISNPQNLVCIIKVEMMSLVSLSRFINCLLLHYDKVGRLTKEFEPFKNLWITAADWQKWYETWMNDSLINIDADVLINSVNNAFKSMHKSVKHFR